MSKARILVAEDERSIRSLLRTYLESEGYEVEEAADGNEALDAILRQPPEVMILDLSMPAPQGMEVLERLHNMAIRPKPRVIVLTAYGSIALAVRAMRLGALDFLEKPSSPEILLATIQRVLAEKVLAESATATGYDALIARARTALADGNYPKAESCLATASSLAGNDPAYFNLLGLFHEINGQFSEARAAYGRSIAADTKYEPARQNMRRMSDLRETGRSQVRADLGL